MNERVTTAPVFASPAEPRSASSHSWAERLMLRLLGLPTIEEAEARMRSRPGFIASLTPEQIAAMEEADPYEVLGSPKGPKRKF